MFSDFQTPPPPIQALRYGSIEIHSRICVMISFDFMNSHSQLREPALMNNLILYNMQDM